MRGFLSNCIQPTTYLHGCCTNDSMSVSVALTVRLRSLDQTITPALIGDACA
jgi:hypothetical protein